MATVPFPDSGLCGAFRTWVAVVSFPYCTLAVNDVSMSCMSEYHDDVIAPYCHPAALHRVFHLEADRKEAEAADQDTESASLTFMTF